MQLYFMAQCNDLAKNLSMSGIENDRLNQQVLKSHYEEYNPFLSMEIQIFTAKGSEGGPMSEWICLL